MGVQVFADRMFEQGAVDDSVVFGVTDFFYEFMNGFRRVATATETANGRHPRVVPAGNEVFFDQLQEFSLAHDGVGQV